MQPVSAFEFVPLNPPLPPDAADDSGPNDSGPHDSGAGPRPPRGAVSRGAAAERGFRAEGAVRFEGILIGHWRSAMVLVGWSWPALVVLLLGGAWWFRERPGDADLPNLAVLLLTAASLASIVQAILRIELGKRYRRPLAQLTLTAIGYRDSAPPPPTPLSEPALASESTAGRGTQRLVLAAAPTLVIFGGGLGLATLASVVQPLGGWGASWDAPDLRGVWELGPAVRVVAWVWLTQAALMGLPIPGSVGRQILQGLVERASRQPSTALSPELIERRVDRFQGAIAVLLAAAAVWQWQRETVETGAPAWPFLIALSILVWSGRGGREIAARGGALSWWSRLRIRRVQRAERGEASDAMQLDAVLERLHRDGFDSLSAAERSILRRVSQRLREKREG